MGGREQGYYGPSPDDLGRGAVLLLAILAAGAALVVALCVAGVGDVEACPVCGCPCDAGCGSEGNDGYGDDG